MAATLAEMTTEIKQLLNRGSRYDTEIAVAIPAAIEFVEDNNSFLYAQGEDQFTLGIGIRFLSISVTPNSTELFPKSIIQVRRDFDPWTVVSKVEQQRFRELETAEPNGWAPKHSFGVNQVWFDNSADISYNYLVMASYRTHTDPDVSISAIDSVLKAQAMLYLSPIIRSGILRDFWTEQRNLSLKAALDRDQEARHEGGDDLVQPYSRELERYRNEDLTS